MYFFLIIFSLLKLFKQYFDFCRINFFLLCLIMNYIIFWDRKFELGHSESAWSLKYQIKIINRVALPVNYETGSCRRTLQKLTGTIFFVFTRSLLIPVGSTSEDTCVQPSPYWCFSQVGPRQRRCPTSDGFYSPPLSVCDLLHGTQLVVLQFFFFFLKVYDTNQRNTSYSNVLWGNCWREKIN